MKKIIFGLVLSLLVLAPLTNLKAASPCDKPSFILTKDDTEIIDDIFKNYTDGNYLKANYGVETILYGDAYYLCFALDTPDPIAPSKTLFFEVKSPHPVYISGLKLKANGVENLLTIENISDTATVTLEGSVAPDKGPDLTDVKTGLVIKGTGKVVVKNINITGDASKLGSCIDVASPNAVFDTVKTSGCKAGITVKANDIQIANSTISNIQTGLVLEGAGKVEVKNTVITGDESKSGSCIDVASPGAFFDTVTAKNCGTGAMVKADNVLFKNSNISNNGIGIHVATGITGMKVEGTAIFGNKDEKLKLEDRLFGILTDSKRDIGFFVKKDNTYVAKEINATTGVAQYELNEDIYMLLPEKPQTSGSIEYFLISCGDGQPSNKQPCTPINKIFEIDSEHIKASNEILFSLLDEYKGKDIVAIYTDPILGSTLISQPFRSLDTPRIVAFVTSGYDMPTSGGYTGSTPGGGDIADSGDDVGSPVGVSQMGGGSDAVIIGAGGGEGMGAVEAVTGGKAGCSLVPNSGTPLQFYGFMWWIILITMPLVVVSFVRVKRK